MKPSPPKTTLRKPKGPENKWTPEEDEVLAAAVATSGFKVCWRKIALSLPGRTNKSCRKRWIHSLDPTLRKGRWTAQEDKILLNAIKQHGTLWYKVAKHLPGRTDDQAAKRFREKLDPSISRTPWAEEEDEILIKMWKQVGKRWNLISKELNGRPAVHCRNRWQSLFRIGKVDGSSQNLQPDFAMDDDSGKGEDDVDVDEPTEVFLSPTVTADIPRLSASSSSSSSPMSSHLSTPIQTSHTLAPGISEPSNSHNYLSYNLSRHSRQDEDDCDSADCVDRVLSSFQNPTLMSPQASRPTSSPAGFFNFADSLASGSPTHQVDSRSKIADTFAHSMTSSRHPKRRLEDVYYQFPHPDDTKPHSQAPHSGRPALFMLPHPNMRILTGSNQQQQQQQQASVHCRQGTSQTPFLLNFGNSARPTSPSFYFPSYDTVPNHQPQQQQLLTSQQYSLSPSSSSHQLNVQLPPAQNNGSNNFMLTCPLVHCGFQSANLLDLWRHVTWDHAGLTPPALNGAGDQCGNSTSRSNFGLETNPDFSSEASSSLKIDPGMMDYMERIVLDIDQQQQPLQGGHHSQHDKRGDIDLGYPMGLHLEDLDPAAAATMSGCVQAVNVSSSA